MLPSLYRLPRSLLLVSNSPSLNNTALLTLNLPGWKTKWISSKYKEICPKDGYLESELWILKFIALPRKDMGRHKAQSALQVPIWWNIISYSDISGDTTVKVGCFHQTQVTQPYKFGRHNLVLIMIRLTKIINGLLNESKSHISLQ